MEKRCEGHDDDDDDDDDEDGDGNEAVQRRTPSEVGDILENLLFGVAGSYAFVRGGPVIVISPARYPP